MHQQDLARLTVGEQAARRAQELEAENERLRQGSGYSPPTAGNPQLAQFQQDFEAAKGGDAEAMLRVVTQVGAASEARAQTLERQLTYARELDQVPDDMKEDVKKRCEATPGLSPSWAQRAIESERWRKESQTLDERRRRLDEEDAARKKGRIDASVTGIPAVDIQGGDMTPAQFQELCDLAEQRTEAGLKAKRKLREFDEGRFKVRPPG